MLPGRQRPGQCCHVGGDIDFDAAGNLYLTTGDDTNPFESGRLRADRRADQPQPAVRRPALRGQHQRPARQAAADQAAGGRHLHDPVGQPVRARAPRSTRPEIYAMGLRNPFRMSVDKADRRRLPRRLRPGRRCHRPPTAAPAGRSSSTGSRCRATTAGRTAPAPTPPPRPTTSAPSRPDRRPAPSTTAAAGRRTTRSATPVSATLPAAKPAWIRYAGRLRPRRSSAAARSRRWVARSTGTTPRSTRRSSSRSRWTATSSPASTAAAGSRPITVNSDGTRGEISSFPWTGTQVMDMAFGPDGALYVLDYGTGSNNQALYRIEYIGGGNRSPIASRLGEPDVRPEPADGQLLLGRQLRPRGRRAELPCGLRRRHHVDGGQPHARRTPPTARTPRR